MIFWVFFPEDNLVSFSSERFHASSTVSKDFLLRFASQPLNEKPLPYSLLTENLSFQSLILETAFLVIFLSLFRFSLQLIFRTN